MSKKVSIVIITWDGLKYLKQDLHMLLDLNYPDYEIIVVDNGSQDGTAEFLKQLKTKNENVVILTNKENLGTSKARNQGADVATGEYILFLDNDINIREENVHILKELIDVYEKLDNPGFMLIPLFDKEYLEERKTRKYGAFYTWYGIKRNSWMTLKQLKKWGNPVAPIATCFSGDMFLSKKVWNDLGSFDESQKFNCDDDDIGSRAAVYGYRNYTYCQNYFIHLGEERRRDNKQYMEYFKLSYSGKARAMLKNFQFSTLIWMFPIYTIFSFLVGIKQGLQRMYPQITLAFFYSFYRFLKNLPDTLKERKKIQSHRKVNDSDFLKLKIPS